MFHFERQSYLGMIKKLSPTSHQPVTNLGFKRHRLSFHTLASRVSRRHRRHNGHNGIGSFGTVSLEALIYVPSGYLT